MASFEVQLKDGTVEMVEGADAYQPDGPFTNFFALEGRTVVDCWSVRMASIRSAEIVAVWRRDARPSAADSHGRAPAPVPAEPPPRRAALSGNHPPR
ncbi:MAG: hypothetical protein ACR2KK_20960, partial [Acidimicrobiales bacterium]